jgi:hypothetical protein
MHYTFDEMCRSPLRGRSDLRHPHSRLLARLQQAILGRPAHVVDVLCPSGTIRQSGRMDVHPRQVRPKTTRSFARL